MIDSPASAHAPSAGKPHSAGWWIAACVGLALLAGLSLVNMFFMHLSPDSALHLIFARDLLEGLPRFETHLDNKGPMWTWIVTGMSLLTGPNFHAMAVIQVVSYAIVAVTMYVGSVRFLDRRAATTAVLLWLILIHNPAMTGAGGRVEDLLVGVSALAWLCALRVTPMRFVFLGVLAGVAVMTKLTAGVAITLLAILALIATDRSSSTPRPKAALCYLLGLIISIGVIILVVVATDNMDRMLYQVFVFPVIYAREQFPTRPVPVVKMAMLMRLGMLLPLLLAFYGARELWRAERQTTKHRLVDVTLAWGLSELIIWFIQLPGVVYHWTMVLPALVIVLVGWVDRSLWAQRPLLAAVGPLFVLLPALGSTAYLQAAILNDRVLDPKPSPEEYLAEQLKPHVQADDVMVVGYYDPTLWLDLDLKIPLGQAPMHLQFVSAEDKDAFVVELAELRPDWIVLTNNQYGEPKSPHAWRFVPLRIYPTEDPPRHQWLSYAEELQEKLDYPLFLETRTHRVYHRPDGER